MEQTSKGVRVLIIVLMYLVSVPIFFFVLYMWPQFYESGSYAEVTFAHDFLVSMLVAVSVVIAPLIQLLRKIKSPETGLT